MKTNEEVEKAQAYEKVGEIKKFYWFLLTAGLVTLLFFGMAYFFAAIDAPDMVTWIFLSMPFVFGIVLLIEYMRVFDKNPLLGKKWEQRKLKQFMEEDRLESEKIRQNEHQ